MHGWVKELAAGGRLPAEVAKHFVVAYQTASGPRTVELLACLAPLALRAKLPPAVAGEARAAPDLLDDAAVTSGWEAELAGARARRQAGAQRLAAAAATLRRLHALGAVAPPPGSGDAGRLQSLQRVLGAGLDLGLERGSGGSLLGGGDGEQTSEEASPAAVIEVWAGVGRLLAGGRAGVVSPPAVAALTLGSPCCTAAVPGAAAGGGAAGAAGLPRRRRPGAARPAAAALGPVRPPQCVPHACQPFLVFCAHSVLPQLRAFLLSPPPDAHPSSPLLQAA